jgi:hypothetical protein
MFRHPGLMSKKGLTEAKERQEHFRPEEWRIQEHRVENADLKGKGNSFHVNPGLRDSGSEIRRA